MNKSFGFTGFSFDIQVGVPSDASDEVQTTARDLVFEVCRAKLETLAENITESATDRPTLDINIKITDDNNVKKVYKSND